MDIKLKELSKLGYTDNVARTIAVMIISKHCKHHSKQEVVCTLKQLLANPESHLGDAVWGKLAEHFRPIDTSRPFKVYDLNNQPAPCKTYGGKHIETIAKQQMLMAMRLPVAVQGALMPDAHAGYGLPIGGVLAVRNAVIPFAVGMDIGCRMALSVFDERTEYINRHAYQVKEALKTYTHFGMDGGLGFKQEHEVLDRGEFKATELLKSLHGKAIRQLGTSGSGNHFVELVELQLFDDNVLNLPEGSYTALLSHSGSRGLGAAIARHYSDIAREVCKLPREAGHFAWLDMDSEAGQEYWLSMNLAGDYATACHDRIHLNLAKALGLKPIAKVENHHNFAWEEVLTDGSTAIVHRKGATPAHNGVVGIIPGSMCTPGYLVSGKGVTESLSSASHGAGRAMSRQKAKDSFTVSSMKKRLAAAGVSLIGGSVEEASQAYKDIEQVMDTQKELVAVHGKMMPRIVRMNKE